MSNQSVVIIDGIRTAHGVLGGSLKEFSAQALGEIVVRALVKRVKIDAKLINEVVFGCVSQQSDAPNLARVISLRAGLAPETTGFTVQRNCASGLQAVVSAYQSIQSGMSRMVIAGGAESMSSAPFVNRDMRFGKKIKNSVMIDSLWEGLTDPICNQTMGQTAEALACEFKISRSQQDEFAALSHERALTAYRAKRFDDEITEVPISRKEPGKAPCAHNFLCDESVRESVTPSALAHLKPSFVENGTVTAGNSCPISDGAACLLLADKTMADQLGLPALAQIDHFSFYGLEPQRMGLGPVGAVRKTLDSAKIHLNDVDLIELNEAFAVQYLACEKMLSLDRNRTNVNGGAIALGHPVGATGARLIVTLIHEMKRRNAKRGLVTMCVGGGQGGALILSRP